MRWPAGTDVSLDESGFHYERHRPGQTLLYQLVEEYYPPFAAQPAAQQVFDLGAGEVVRHPHLKGDDQARLRNSARTRELRQ